MSQKKIKTSNKTLSSDGMTMDELLKKFGTDVKSLSVGDKVTGVIIEKTPGRVVVDIGGKSEGLVAEKSYKESESYIKTINVGDKIEARVIVPEMPDGYTILSLRQASTQAVWSKLRKAYEGEEAVSVEGKSANPSGIVVEIDGITGYVPRSQVSKEVLKNIQSLVGKRFKVKIIDIDQDAKRVIFSEKEVSEAEELGILRDAIAKIKIGETYDGEITSIYDFGCFVRVMAKIDKNEVPVEGLVHISELSWEKISKPSDTHHEGDKVKVKVIGKDKGKLALSIKQVIEDPWERIEEKYYPDLRIDGKVVKQSDFGIFVGLEPGVEGLVHMTKIPPGKKFVKGDSMKVIIEEVDGANRKISLGLVLTEKPIGYK